MPILIIAIAVVAIAAAVMLVPKAVEPPPQEFDGSGVPTAEEGRPLGIIFGTVRVENANVVWYGDVSYEEIESDGGK